MPTLPQEVTAVVTDPPYGLEFMGQDWDKQVPGRHFWELINQVCVPGSPLLSFGGTRTYHRLVCAIEDAGWKIRDFINWMYGTGFPKSHDIGKATGDKQWQGHGTALKPAHEPICLAMKPLSEKSYAKNALVNGVAGINVDGCRVGDSGGHTVHTKSAGEHRDRWEGNLASGEKTENGGRWPANVIHDGTALKPAHEPICLAMKPLSEKSYAKNALVNGVAGINVDGCRVSLEKEIDISRMQQYQTEQSEYYFRYNAEHNQSVYNTNGRWPANVIHDGTQGIARFFYCAKPTEKEKDANFKVLNTHSTVKPLALMRYLLKLVTMPKRNLVLDPFMGSGTTGVACQELGLPFIGIDDNERSFQIARDRIIASNTERDNPSNTNSDSINAAS